MRFVIVFFLPIDFAIMKIEKNAEIQFYNFVLLLFLRFRKKNSSSSSSINAPTAATGTTYDDLTDGSSTDGSISLLGDHEFMCEESDGNTSTVSRSPQPSQFWMRCQQPEIVLSSRPIFRPLANEMERCSSAAMDLNATVTSTELQQRATIVDQYLTNLNEKITQSNLFNVLLLVLTGCSFAIFAILYARYITTPVNISQLKEMIRNLEIENGELSQELRQCQIKETCNSVTLNEQNQCENGSNSIQGKCEQPSTTETTQQTKSQDNERIVWTGDGLQPQMANIAPKKQFKYEHLCDEVIHDDLFADYIRDYCTEIRYKQNDEKNTPIENTKPINYHPKKSQRRMAKIDSITTSVPDISTNNFEFNEQYIDPNQFNTDLSAISGETFYDDYDYGQHIESAHQHKSKYDKGTPSAVNNDMVSIEEILLQMDEHLEQVTQSCYLKYKQLKDDNIFNPAVIQKAQKKLLKLKKKLQKNEKREKQNDDDANIRNENVRKRDKQKQKQNRKDSNRKVHEKTDTKWNKTATTKDYKKTALKNYDEHRF